MDVLYGVMACCALVKAGHCCALSMCACTAPLDSSCGRRNLIPGLSGPPSCGSCCTLVKTGQRCCYSPSAAACTTGRGSASGRYCRLHSRISRRPPILGQWQHPRCRHCSCSSLRIPWCCSRCGRWSWSTLAGLSLRSAHTTGLDTHDRLDLAPCCHVKKLPPPGLCLSGNRQRPTTCCLEQPQANTPPWQHLAHQRLVWEAGTSSTALRVSLLPLLLLQAAQRLFSDRRFLEWLRVLIQAGSHGLWAMCCLGIDGARATDLSSLIDHVICDPQLCLHQGVEDARLASCRYPNGLHRSLERLWHRRPLPGWFPICPGALPARG